MITITNEISLNTFPRFHPWISTFWRQMHMRTKGCVLHQEEMLMHFLMKNEWGKSHAEMCDHVTQGRSPTRMFHGCEFMSFHLDHRHQDLIGPVGLEKWSNDMPMFAEKIRSKTQKNKCWWDNNSQQHVQEPCGVHFAPGNFSVCGFVDCKDFKMCRPGSGPSCDPFHHVGARRHPNWCPQQRAFFGGHHRQHGVKALSFSSPNGSFAACFGPCSARGHDTRILD